MKKYDNYKDSGIEWIGEIPDHWNIVRGKDILKFTNGYPFNSGLFSKDEKISRELDPLTCVINTGSAS